MHAFLAALFLAAPGPSVFHVEIHGSIEASFASLSPRPQSVLAAQVARLVRWRGDVVKNVHKGDLMTVLYEGGDEPELVALDYQGAEITLHAYRYAAADGVQRYWDENGVLIEPWIESSPLASYVQITETVQRGRGKRKHDGLDFKAPEGTPVVLPFAAQIGRVNWSRRVNGNCVEVVFTNGRVGRFLHLSRIDAGMRAGDRLGAGARVGDVGTTGRSNAPHLHYEIRDASGAALDPLAIHGTTKHALDEASRAGFATLRATYDRMLAVRTTARL